MGFFHAVHRITPARVPPAHAFRTHVKAPQTDLHAKPDNSSGPTHNSPSKRPLRTKATFQPKTAPKKHRRRQAVREALKPSTDRLFLPAPNPIRDRNQGPKGSIETKTSSTSMLRAMGETLKASGQTPWLHASVTEAVRLGDDRSRLPIPLGWDWLASESAMRLPAGAVLL